MVEESRLPVLSGCTILIMDDDHNILRSMSRLFNELQAQVVTAASLREARLKLEVGCCDVVLADLKLKDGVGLDLLPLFQQINPDGLFYLLTGHGSVDNAVQALKSGVRDYLQKPVDLLGFARRLQKDMQGRKKPVLVEKLEPYLTFRDPVMVNALADLPRFAALDEPVLIKGESGTGKELVARAVHKVSPRANGPFVAVNCGAIPETMIESELFGYEKGAFTGAVSRHKGRFEQASGGTLFLDEIGEMPLQFQVRLLRVLEERTIQRLGGEKSIPVDVRIVAATNRNLYDDIDSGLFRRDLFYRLDVLPLSLPPLRERKRDIVLLSIYFLQRTFKEMGVDNRKVFFSIEAEKMLLSYPWRGNIRELRNVMTRVAVRLPEELSEISAEFIEPFLFVNGSLDKDKCSDSIAVPLDANLAQVESIFINAVLKKHDFNRKKTAAQLGISERTLRRKLADSK